MSWLAKIWLWTPISEGKSGKPICSISCFICFISLSQLIEDLSLKPQQQRVTFKEMRSSKALASSVKILLSISQPANNYFGHFIFHYNKHPLLIYSPFLDHCLHKFHFNWFLLIALCSVWKFKISHRVRVRERGGLCEANIRIERGRGRGGVCSGSSP